MADARLRWKARPVAAALLRGGVIAVPIAASVLTAAVISRLLPPPGPGLQAAAWWMIVTAPATGVLWLVDRLARRILPLATLLRLTMLFPDRAPSRYAVARAAGSTRSLERRLARARSHGIDDEPTAAAATLLALVAALSAHDRRTRGHAERVRVYTDMLSEQLGLASDGKDRLRWTALVHDMGKLAVPARLLNKRGAPSDAEWQVLRRHPAEGARLCAPLLPWLGEWGKAIIEHHEHFDGTGYPAGLAGEEISPGARILAVADAYEVMTAPRAYRRRPLGAIAAREELARCAGTHFDPVAVRAFLNISLGRMRLAMGPLAWLAQWPVLRRAPELGPAAGWTTASIGGAAALTIGGAAHPPRMDSPAAAPVEIVVMQVDPRAHEPRRALGEASRTALAEHEDAPALTPQPGDEPADPRTSPRSESAAYPQAGGSPDRREADAVATDDLAPSSSLEPAGPAAELVGDVLEDPVGLVGDALALLPDADPVELVGDAAAVASDADVDLSTAPAMVEEVGGVLDL